MKVKDLAVIFKVEVSELLAMLSNVGVNLDKQEETNIDSAMEKKLAKRYGVPYPFKTAAPKPKPVNKVEIPNAKETKQTAKQTSTTKPQTSSTKKTDPKGTNKETNNKKVSNNNGRNEASKQATTKKSETPKQEVKETKQEVKETKQVKPQTIILQKDEIVAPRVDEETLNKYSHFLDDDEYNITRENRPKKNTYGNKESDSTRRKKNVKNNKNNKQSESRKSNLPKKQENEEKVLYYENGMSCLEISEAMNVSVTDLVKKLFVSMGMMVSANSSMDRETAELL